MFLSEVYMGCNLGMGGQNIENANAVNTKEILNNQEDLLS
jgi:hypothetical protein